MSSEMPLGYQNLFLSHLLSSGLPRALPVFPGTWCCCRASEKVFAHAPGLPWCGTPGHALCRKQLRASLDGLIDSIQRRRVPPHPHPHLLLPASKPATSPLYWDHRAHSPMPTGAPAHSTTPTSLAQVPAPLGVNPPTSRPG